jgi:hypothetical protein
MLTNSWVVCLSPGQLFFDFLAWVRGPTAFPQCLSFLYCAADHRALELPMCLSGHHLSYSLL